MPKTIIGTFRLPNGIPAANATISFQLSRDAVAVGITQIAPQVVELALTPQGTIPANTTLYANDELTPSGTSYTIVVTALGGGRIWGPEVMVLSGGSPINLTPQGGGLD